MSSSTPIFISNLSEERWNNHMTQNYTKNLKIHPCVFRVPQTMKDIKPEAYTPQVVGLGPYHHFQPEVQQMECRKRGAVEQYIKKCYRIKGFEDFINLVKEMTKTQHTPVNEMTEKKSEKMPEEGLREIRETFEPIIRSSYDRYLDLDGKTLSWIMVVDGIFLLHVLENYPDPKIERLVPDTLMLENQIPLEVLIEIRKALKLTVTKYTDIVLSKIFTTFCVKNSPFKLSENSNLREAAFENHMLHYMHKLIVENDDHQKSDASAGSSSRTSGLESPEERFQGELKKPDERSSEKCSANIRVLAEKTVLRLTDVFKKFPRLTAAQAKEVFKQMGDSVSSGYRRVISSGVKVPNNIEKAAEFLQKLKKNSNLYDQTDNPLQKILVQEIDVPSVSQLHQIAKMKFARTEGGIKNVRMDWHNNTLYLPVITLRANSEVVLRNLVAYEVASGSNLVLTEYLDLMCGIIDTENDVKLLKEEKIIEGDLRDDEIVSIFNGINKSTERQHEKSRVQEIVQEVNEKFGKIWIVKAYNSFKKFLARLRDLMTQIFPLLVLILLTLQYICDVRGCSSRRLGYAAVSWDSSPGNGSSLSLDSQANYLMISRKMLRYSG